MEGELEMVVGKLIILLVIDCSPRGCLRDITYTAG
jgi:hypothetical protein